MENIMTNIEIDFGNSGYKVKANLSLDGDAWCVLMGDNIQVGIVGWGKTPELAITDFQNTFRNPQK